MANLTKEILSPDHINEGGSRIQNENITIGLPPSGTPARRKGTKVEEKPVKIVKEAIKPPSNYSKRSR